MDLQHGWDEDVDGERTESTASAISAQLTILEESMQLTFDAANAKKTKLADVLRHFLATYWQFREFQPKITRLLETLSQGERNQGGKSSTTGPGYEELLEMNAKLTEELDQESQEATRLRSRLQTLIAEKEMMTKENLALNGEIDDLRGQPNGLEEEDDDAHEECEHLLETQRSVTAQQTQDIERLQTIYRSALEQNSQLSKDLQKAVELTGRNGSLRVASQEHDIRIRRLESEIDTLQ